MEGMVGAVSSSRAPGIALIPDSDAELMRRVALSDGRAFELLFARHRDALHGFLHRRLRQHEEAEDAVTLTFYKAWRARESYRGSVSGKSWLYQIAARVALDLIRRRRTSIQPEGADEAELETVVAERGDPAVQVLDRERGLMARKALQEAMNRLPDAERTMLRLFYWDGHNYEQISTQMGITRSQVRGRLHRVRERVRRDLVTRQGWSPQGGE
jgi:RNA polymerase sigma-70 factor (ECF subfamily)